MNLKAKEKTILKKLLISALVQKKYYVCKNICILLLFCFVFIKMYRKLIAKKQRSNSEPSICLNHGFCPLFHTEMHNSM